MKVSIITACRNAAATLRDAMTSVATQQLRLTGEDLELEYIVVDGASTDGTVDLLRDFAARFAETNGGVPGLSFKWVSEPDRGLYDAINKGIGLATGDVVGICNADDILASDDVLATVAKAFDGGTDLAYADIRFVRDVAGLCSLRAAKTIRYCTGRFFRCWMFRFATFPAHPSTFVRREWLIRTGGYSLDYRICADFELMLRLFLKHRLVTRYLPICTHVMRMGGMSTGGLKSNVEINREDLRALRANGIWSCLPLIYLKYVAKVWGFIFK